MSTRIVVAAILLTLAGCSRPPHYDVIIRNGTVIDGSGAPGVAADVAIQGQRIAAVGIVGPATATTEVDASGLAVAPGFINMLSPRRRR